MVLPNELVPWEALSFPQGHRKTSSLKLSGALFSVKKNPQVCFHLHSEFSG